MAKKIQTYMSSAGIHSLESGAGPASIDAMPSPYGIHARAVTIVQHHDDHYGPPENVLTEREHKESYERGLVKVLKEVRDFNAAGSIIAESIAAKHGIDLDPA